MNDLRQFTTMRNVTDNLDKLFEESAGLEQVIRQQLAGLKYAN